jgi:hypothetical protein
MGNGDISAIEELGRTALPSGGFVGVSAVPTSHKVMVWGRITCLYATTGVKLGAEGGMAALGIKGKPDFLSLIPRQGGATATANPTALKGFMANLEVDNTTELIFIVDEVGADSGTPPSAGETFTIDYFVVGEDNRKAVVHG